MGLGIPFGLELVLVLLDDQRDDAVTRFRILEKRSSARGEALLFTPATVASPV